jgi:hypothetical protein
MRSLLFLDSGAYSAYMQKTTIVLQDYINFIKEHESEIETYANLDDIGSVKNTWKNQEEMERQGLHPIPVYHMDEDEKYLRRAMEYEYFAVGGLTLKSSSSLKNNLDRVFQHVCTEKTDYYPSNKIHGFGIATPSLLIRYPWWSADTASWVLYGKYGMILIPRIKNGEFRYDLPPYTITVSSRSKAIGDENHFRNLSSMERKQIELYCKKENFIIGKTLYKQVKAGYVLKENEKFTDRKTKDRVEVIVEDGLCCNHELRDSLNLRYFLNLEKFQKPYPWRWVVRKNNLFI